jgi:hypothetical protein
MKVRLYNWAGIIDLAVEGNFVLDIVWNIEILILHLRMCRNNVPRDNATSNLGSCREVETISSYGADPLRGRGTCVFEAIEIDSDGGQKGSHVVLKDIWIDSDRMSRWAVQWC